MDGLVFVSIWQDNLLPFMMDERFPKDTLFLVFEEDFRWWPDENEPLERAKGYDARVKARKERAGDPSTGRTLVSPPPPAYAPGGPASSSTAPPGPPGQNVESWYKTPPDSRRACGLYHKVPAKGQAELDQLDGGYDKNFADTVRLCNLAHREKAGDLIWLSWCPGSTRRSCIGHGAMLLGLTCWGAMDLNAAIRHDQLAKGHWDVSLKHWLMAEETRQAEVNFSYLLPPLGNYSEHASGCDDQFASAAAPVRPANWKEVWCCPGSRKKDDPQRRDKYLCRLRRVGEPEWLLKIRDFDTYVDFTPLQWTTFFEAKADMSLPLVLVPREGVLAPPSPSTDDDDDKALTKKEAAAAASGSGGGGAASSEPTAAGRGVTKRSKRRKRARKDLTSRRVWVDDADKVVLAFWLVFSLPSLFASPRRSVTECQCVATD